MNVDSNQANTFNAKLNFSRLVFMNIVYNVFCSLEINNDSLSCWKSRNLNVLDKQHSSDVREDRIPIQSNIFCALEINNDNLICGKSRSLNVLDKQHSADVREDRIPILSNIFCALEINNEDKICE
jgi:hypothetical protein